MSIIKVAMVSTSLELERYASIFSIGWLAPSSITSTDGHNLSKLANLGDGNINIPLTQVVTRSLYEQVQ
jgi:hypothetical protein